MGFNVYINFSTTNLHSFCMDTAIILDGMLFLGVGT